MGGKRVKQFHTIVGKEKQFHTIVDSNTLISIKVRIMRPMNKEREDLKSTISQLSLTKLYPTRADCTFFSSAYGTSKE